MSIYDGMRSALVRHIFRSVVADPVQELFIDNAIELGLWGYRQTFKGNPNGLHSCAKIQGFISGK